MQYPFTGGIGVNMTFNPVLDNNTYNAVIVWNAYAQRWYLNLSDLNGNLTISRAVTASADPLAISTLTWYQNVVTVTTVAPHFLRLGSVVNLRISGASPDGYNGIYLCRVTGPSSFQYDLTTNPGQQVSAGNYGGIIDLTDGAFTSSVLVFYDNSQTFETIP